MIECSISRTMPVAGSPRRSETGGRSSGRLAPKSSRISALVRNWEICVYVRLHAVPVAGRRVGDVPRSPWPGPALRARRGVRRSWVKAVVRGRLTHSSWGTGMSAISAERPLPIAAVDVAVGEDPYEGDRRPRSVSLVRRMTSRRRRMSQFSGFPQAAVNYNSTIIGALESSEKKWVLAVQLPGVRRHSRHVVDASGDGLVSLSSA